TTTQTLVLAVLSCRKRCDSQPTAFYSFFNDTATTEIYTLSLHDALPISVLGPQMVVVGAHHDRLGRERRVGPREDPDDIHAAPLLVAEVDPQTRAHARSERGRGLAADRGRDESDPGGGRVERWQRVADEQERRRAAPLRRDELLAPRHAPAVRGPV